jgi:hypothetical protein
LFFSSTISFLSLLKANPYHHPRYATLCDVHDRRSELLIHTTNGLSFCPKREGAAPGGGQGVQREMELGWELLGIGGSAGRGEVEGDDGRRPTVRDVVGGWWRWFDCRTAGKQKEPKIPQSKR